MAMQPPADPPEPASGKGAEKNEGTGKPLRPTVLQINVLRVLAMLAIFFHHLWKGIPQPVGDGAWEKGLNALFLLGDRGVIFFNLISGFVLALPYLGLEHRPVPNTRRFLRTRFLRIAPPYYLALLWVSAANLLIIPGLPAAPVLVSFLEHAVFIQSFNYASFFSNTAAYWYMGLLVQFYLAFLLVLRLFLRLGPARGSLTLCTICWGGCWLLGLYLEAHPGSLLGMTGFLIYFNLPARLPEFAIGMWMASAWDPVAGRSRPLPFDRPFLLFLGGMFLFAVLGAPFAAKLDDLLSLVHQVAWCFILFTAIFVFGPAAEWGQPTPVRRVAAASYSIYLVHQPLLSYADLWLPASFSRLADFVVLTALVAPASYLLARAIDILAAAFAWRTPPAGKPSGSS